MVSARVWHGCHLLGEKKSKTKQNNFENPYFEVVQSDSNLQNLAFGSTFLMACFHQCLCEVVICFEVSRSKLCVHFIHLLKGAEWSFHLIHKRAYPL
jgi:hypothetical protein